MPTKKFYFLFVSMLQFLLYINFILKIKKNNTSAHHKWCSRKLYVNRNALISILSSYKVHKIYCFLLHEYICLHIYFVYLLCTRKSNFCFLFFLRFSFFNSWESYFKLTAFDSNFSPYMIMSILHTVMEH